MSAYTRKAPDAGQSLQPVSSPFVAHAKCWTRLLSGAALAMTAALAIQGCTAAPASTTRAGSAPALTTAQARQVFGSYVAASDQAARNGDATLALSCVTGVQWVTVGAELKAAAFDGTAPDRYSYGPPTFYLPQPDGYPRWFVASVRRTAATGRPGRTSAVAGLPVAAQGQVLMVFEQAGAASPWLLASTSQLPVGSSVPPLAADSGGHVATVPLDTTALLARPDVTGPLQAAVVDDGPASPAAKIVAPGNLTTGIYQAARSAETGLARPAGDVYQWELEGSHYAEFALRTAAGGALVFYAMYLNSAVEVPAELSKGVVTPGPPITVPGYLAFLLPPGSPAPRVRLQSQRLLSFAAVDPPAGAGKNSAGSGGTTPPTPREKIQVIAIGGGLIYASAS